MNELARWDPFKPALPFEGSMLDIIPAFLRPVARRFGGPAMDVNETENAYELAIELPGVKKEAIQVGVYDNSLTISAEVAEEKSPADDKADGEEHRWLLRERSFGKFSRNITLPEPVDEASSQARYADGVLYLTLQKKRASQVKRLTVH